MALYLWLLNWSCVRCATLELYQDPTTENRQENDRGTQYASAIFTHDAKQTEIASRVTAELQVVVAAGKIPRYATTTVTTAIRPASAFIAADQDHQRYLEVNPEGYCEMWGRVGVWGLASLLHTSSFLFHVTPVGNHRKRFSWEDLV